MSTFEFDDSSLADLGDKNTKVDTADVGGKPAPAAAPVAAPIGAPIGARKQIYTVMAQQGIDAAQVVNAALQKRTLGTLTPRRVEVIAPHGPSTSGGKKARQSITLTPAAGGGAAIVFGFLDVAAKTYETRPYAVVAQQFKARFGEPFEATVEEYDGLCRDLGKIVGTLGFKLSETRDEPSAPQRLPQRPDAGRPSEAAEDDEFDEDDVLGGPSKQQKLMMLAAGVVATIVLTLWWLK